MDIASVDSLILFANAGIGARLFSRQLSAEDRPTLMITPAPGDLQVTGRESLQLESQRFHQCDRTNIGRLDICLQTVQFESAKRKPQCQLKGFSHQPLTLMSFEGIKAQIGTLEGAAIDLADIDDSYNCASVVSANQECAKIILLHPSEVCPET